MDSWVNTPFASLFRSHPQVSLLDLLILVSQTCGWDGLGLFCVLMWSNWWNRNTAIHEGRVKAPRDVLEFSLSFLAEFQSSQGSTSPPRASPAPLSPSWTSPPPALPLGLPPLPLNCLKLNTDAAVRNGSSSFGVRAVIRNELGRVVDAVSKSLLGNFPAEMGEFLALREGLLFAKSLGLKLWSIEVDASNVASRISPATFPSVANCNDDVVNIIDDIRILSRDVGGCTCSNIPRKSNVVAHRLAALALSSGSIKSWQNVNLCSLLSSC